MDFNINETIAAISTPMGEGGIGIIRISGGEALNIADSVFLPSSGEKPSSYSSHTVHYGRVRHPGTGEIMDEALITLMRSPRTYTREDVVEISCHGGDMSLKKTLDACLSAGARIAEPGEFTKRAFLNGRIDLAQAEAVMDIITSGTEKAQRLALGQLSGGLSAKVEELRESLLDILALLELSIDFSEEDVAQASSGEIASRISTVLSGILELSGTAPAGMMLRSGASVVICGRPNVGKSSLMNALLKHDRVIVTPVAGTTRDVVEEHINLNGVKVRLSDTAGIVDTADRVEMEGIRRSRQKLASADLAIFMVDASSEITAWDMGIYDAVKCKKHVIAMNKIDIAGGLSGGEAAGNFRGEEVVMISALEKKGLEELEKAMFRKLFEGSSLPEGESPVIMNARHKVCLEMAGNSAKRALDMVSAVSGAEFIAADIAESVRALGMITGRSVEDDVLKKIFADFCIGK